MVATIVDLKVSGDTVTSRIEMRGDLDKAAGVDRFITISTLTFTGDKI